MHQLKNFIKKCVIFCSFFITIGLHPLHRPTSQQPIISYAQFKKLQQNKETAPIKPFEEYKEAIEKKAAKLETTTQQLKSQRSKQCYDLIMLMDTFYDENIDSKNQAIGTQFCEALVQKKHPIIVSSNLVYNVCTQNMSYNITKPLSYGTRPFGGLIPQVYQINLTDNDWYCYDHPTSNIMLFVPKNYISQFANLTDENNDKQMKLCGFDVLHLIKINSLSPAALIKYIDNKNKNNYSKEISVAIESMFHIPDKPNSPTWNIYLIGHGLTDRNIAGLSIDNFRKLLKIFQKIKCSYLHYVSCYAGGFNQNIVKNELSQLNVNFIVSAQGINEDFTYGQNLISPYLKTYFLTDFFTIAESFFGHPVEFAQKKGFTKFSGKDLIAAILDPLINKSVLDWSQPFVYLPTVGVFNALSIDKSVKIITNTIAKAYEFENKPMNFTDPAIDTIIIYPDYISIPLQIKSHVAIVSPIKEIDPTIHIFENLTYEDKLSSMIHNFLSFNKKLGSTIFAIKKLQCFNYKNSGLEENNYKKLIYIEDMIILSVMGKDHFNVYILFNFNKKPYSLNASFEFGEMEISNFYELSKKLDKELFEKIHNLPAQETSQVKFPSRRTNDLFYDFMPYSLHNYFRAKKRLSEPNPNRTLADIINLLKSEIDIPIQTEEKQTSLKDVLLQKQAILKAQKIIPEQPKKIIYPKKSEPIQSWIDYFIELIIGRYKKHR